MKILVAVAINAEGEWYAIGCSDWPRDILPEEASGHVSGSSVVHFIEADVPDFPAPQTIRANVASPAASAEELRQSAEPLLSAIRELETP